MRLLLLLMLLIAFSPSLKSQIPIDPLKIVDYHVHIFSEELLENLEKQGYSFGASGFQVLNSDKSDYHNIDKIIQENSQAKMLLISGGYTYKDLEGNSAEVEEKMLQKENNLLSSLVKKHPDQLIGFYGVNPLKDFTIREIKRCHEELGLHGIKLHFQGNKIDLNDPEHLKRVKAIFELASKEKIPLLIHNNALDLNAGKEYGALFIDSLLNQIDSLTIIFAHTGGGGGYFNFTHDFLTLFKYYFKYNEHSKRHKIFFELSATLSMTDYPGEKPREDLQRLILEIGEDKFLYGTDYPYRNSERYIEVIKDQLKLDEQILKRIIERDIFEVLKN